MFRAVETNLHQPLLGPQVRLAPRRFVALVLSSLTWICPAWCEVSATNHPLPGIACYSEIRKQPPMRLFIAEIDLTHPQLRLRVSPAGPDPDGPGPWQTTLMPPTQIAAREGLDLVVNGDFFHARGVKDAEGTNSAFRSKLWSSVTGPAVTDGRLWATNATRRPCLVVRKDRSVAIRMLDHPEADDWQVVAGNTMLVNNGEAVPHANKVRHPRTVVGLNSVGNKLVLLVVDGRKPGVAVGMNYDELAVEMIRLGCQEAFNLDGGGSSVMAVREPDNGTFRILNQPTDGHERPVANVLGISVRKRSSPANASSTPRQWN
jgi:hypothetical protein